jgi:hypothetical protein
MFAFPWIRRHEARFNRSPAENCPFGNGLIIKQRGRSYLWPVGNRAWGLY